MTPSIAGLYDRWQVIRPSRIACEISLRTAKTGRAISAAISDAETPSSQVLLHRLSSATISSIVMLSATFFYLID